MLLGVRVGVAGWLAGCAGSCCQARPRRAAVLTRLPLWPRPAPRQERERQAKAAAGDEEGEEGGAPKAGKKKTGPQYAGEMPH